jgi:YbbR domain-containing protein
MGTRHRAALGLSERTDALVLIVSEERGTVSVAVGGELSEVSTPEELLTLLETALLNNSIDTEKPSIMDRILSNLVPKFVTLVLVTACWLLINAKQGGLQTVTAQVKFHNLPENLVLIGDLPGELEVQLKVLSTIFASSKKLEVAADLDLARLHEGVNSISVDSKAFQLPLGVSVAKVTPASLKIVAEKKTFKDLPVHLRKEGRLPKGLRLRSVTLNPSRVRLVGSASALAVLNQVETEPVDLATLSRSQIVAVRLHPPSPQVQVKPDDTVNANFAIEFR